jgi:putative transposase
MAKARFTEEQITVFLQQLKNGVPAKELCEANDFSMSTLRRWQEQHAEHIRGELKKMETTASYIYLGFLIVCVTLALIFSKTIAMWAFPFFLLYCVSYIRRYRALSATHIKEDNTSLARSGIGANNAFYIFSWTMLLMFLCSLGYGGIRLIFD